MNLLVNKAKRNTKKSIKMNFVFLVTFWTVILCFSLWYNIADTYDSAKVSALIQARTIFEKDLVYRRWSSMMDGVYVVSTPAVPPNPYLAKEGREAVTTTGIKLTKVNPAYMTRLIHEMDSQKLGVIGRISSNDPIRPKNIATEWDSEALTKFEKGFEGEISGIKHINGVEYMRFIKPLYVEESCMSCHAYQGYEIGEVRGGISVAVPMAPLMLVAKNTVSRLIISHFAIWILGIGVFLLSTRKLLSNEIERNIADELKSQLEKQVQDGIAEVEKKQTALHTFMTFTEALVYLKDTKLQYSMCNENYVLVVRANEYIDVQENDGIASKYQDVFSKIHKYETIVLNTQQSIHPEDVFKFDDSGKVYAAAMFPVLNSKNGLEGMGGMFFDITSRISMEKDLMAAKIFAENASRAKSDFVANVSHEIRTPLNGIIGMADVLIRTPLTDDQVAMVSTIMTGGDTLLSLLNDVLDFSKIEADKVELELEVFSLRDVFFDMAKCFSPIAHKKNLNLIITISPQIPDCLIGDAVRIRQILFNLVSNAIKFTENGKIIITISILHKDDNNVSFYIGVMDSGIGIPLEKQDSVFSAFEQADSSTARKYGGTGLGLSISSKLVELMGSKFKLESQPDIGSIFFFDLTLPISNKHDLLRCGITVERLKNVKVLVIEDNSANLSMISDQLNDLGMEVEKANSIYEAMPLLTDAASNEKAFSLVFIDLEKAENGGLDFINEIQSNPALKETPLVALSSSLDLIPNLLNDNNYMINIDKPVQSIELLRAIASVLAIWERFDLNITQQCGVIDNQHIVGINLKILLVDDMEINQIVVSKMLSILGHTVTLAENGEKALEIILDEDFDLVFMDIQMPVMNGEQATKIIREREASNNNERHLPIVAMTAHALKGDKEKYIAKGMDEYISKPVSLNALTALIDKMIESFNIVSRDKQPQEQTHIEEISIPISTEDFDLSSDSIDKDNAVLEHDIMGKIFGTNEAFILKAMKLYLRDAPDMIEDIKEAINNNDNSNLMASAHRLKGITAYYNNSELLNACQAIELIGQENQLPEYLEDVNDNLSILLKGYTQLIVEMKDYVLKSDETFKA